MRQCVAQSALQAVRTSMLIVLLTIVFVLNSGMAIMWPNAPSEFEKDEVVHTGGTGLDLDDEAWFADVTIPPTPPYTPSFLSEGTGDINDISMGQMELWDSFIHPDDEWSLSDPVTAPDHYICLGDGQNNKGAYIVVP
jgi:hypothetical protein